MENFKEEELWELYLALFIAIESPTNKNCMLIKEESCKELQKKILNYIKTK